MPRLSFKKFETDYPPSSVAEYIVEFIWNKIVRPKEATYLFLIHSTTYLSLEITNLLIAMHYHIYTFCQSPKLNNRSKYLCLKHKQSLVEAEQVCALLLIYIYSAKASNIPKIKHFRKKNPPKQQKQQTRYHWRRVGCWFTSIDCILMSCDC